LADLAALEFNVRVEWVCFFRYLDP
jgi:hypothetical protein